MTVVINGTTYIAVGDLWLIDWAKIQLKNS